jgi:RNA polymerase sigma-70 factor, ECF subfamily
VVQGEITRLLNEAAKGDTEAEDQLASAVYPELVRIAARHLTKERRDHTLQSTDLVNEAYLKLAAQFDREWKNRAHFFAVASHVMRLILVDHARAHRAEKRGGECAKVPIEQIEHLIPFAPEQYDLVIALDGALSELNGLDPRGARVVELHCFGGMVLRDTAKALGVSVRTVKRDLEFARTWLHGKLSQPA